MELLPLGPVLFIDTAGIDDVGALGEMAAERTRLIFERTDLGFWWPKGNCWGEFEEGVIAELSKRQAPAIVVFNKVISPRRAQRSCKTSSPGNSLLFTRSPAGAKACRNCARLLIRTAPEEFMDSPPVLGT